MLLQQSNIGALGMLCRYRRVLLEHSEGCGDTEEYWGGCAGTAEYYRNTVDAVLVQPSTTEALGRLCWYSKVL